MYSISRPSPVNKNDLFNIYVIYKGNLSRKIGQFHYNLTLLNQNARFFVFKLRFYPPFSDLNGLKAAFHFNRIVAKRSVFYCVHVISSA